MKTNATILLRVSGARSVRERSERARVTDKRIRLTNGKLFDRQTLKETRRSGVMYSYRIVSVTMDEQC